MRNKHIAIFIFLGLLFSNCASVKLSDSLATDDFNTAKTKKLLVIARSDDTPVRQVYENALVSKLKAQGTNAVASYKIFPNLKEKKNRTQEEIDGIVSMFKKEGIESIMLTALKNTEVQTSSTEKTANYGSVTNTRKYGIGFANYYNVNSIEYLSKDLKPVDSYGETTDFPLSSTVYTLESVIYDLTLEENEQLVGAYEITATDPSSAKQVLEKFTTIISKQFKK